MIVVSNWNKYQPPASRTGSSPTWRPPWIKFYAALTSNDKWLDLSLADRGLLVSLWLEYSNSGRRLSEDTAKLSRRIGQRVRNDQLNRLAEAGFIDLTGTDAVPDEITREEEEESRSNQTKADQTRVGQTTRETSDSPVRDEDCGRTSFKF